MESALQVARIFTSLLWAAFICFGIQFFSNRAASERHGLSNRMLKLWCLYRRKRRA
jgi:hypothetical protein